MYFENTVFSLEAFLFLSRIATTINTKKNKNNLISYYMQIPDK